MNTRDLILKVGTELLTEKGYNAFSYADISERVKIKKASIHYHFPTKTDLGIAIVESHIAYFEDLKERQTNLTEFKKLQSLAKYYIQLINEKKICIMGTFSTDVNSIEPALKKKSIEFCQIVIQYTADILEAGAHNNEFKPIEDFNNKAIEILSSFMGLAQMSRIYSQDQATKTIQGIINQL